MCESTGMGAMTEETQMSELIQRLNARYPRVPLDTITTVVHDTHAAFSGARIREFVPLFVERRARSALTEIAV
jgi:hypothetical protein